MSLTDEPATGSRIENRDEGPQVGRVFWRPGALEPHTETFRPFYFFSALIGTAVTSLVLTYLDVSIERIAHARSTP